MAPFSATADTLPPPLTAADFPAVDPDQAALGQLLFYDKILSGNRNISCATCHSVDHGTGDALPLGVGEGGHGIGPTRTTGNIERRVPRNAPGLWNLGATDITIMMHDGRISRDNLYGNHFNTPAEERLPGGLTSLLAAQALFPVTSEIEMAGRSDENEVAGAVNDRIDNAWPIIAKRVRTIPAYGDAFVAAYDHITAPEDVTITDIANAIGAYQSLTFRSYDSPFDQYLAGDDTALTAPQKTGMDLFYGDAGCASCHSGPLMTDQDFHAIGLPPFGPGRTRRFDLINRDVGRMGKTDDLADAYAFRTPMLRNVALTAPYGHNGAYQTLPEIIRHHADPLGMLATWRPDMTPLPAAAWLEKSDFVIWQDSAEIARQRAAIATTTPPLTQADITALAAFMEALTGTTSLENLTPPTAVPSGLPLD